MRHLLLTGFMGTGKTTIGRLLAARYGLPFIDIDEEIERLAGRDIVAIFAEQGEHVFRDLEHEAFARTLQKEPAVIATGGGLLVQERNRLMLDPDDRVICLSCEVGELEARIGDRRTRPLLARLAAEEVRPALSAGLAERLPVYSRYPEVDTTGRSPNEVAAAVAALADPARVGRLELPGRATSTVSAGQGILADALGGAVPGAALVVTDERVAECGHLDAVCQAIDPVAVAIIPAGEQYKTLATAERVYRAAKDAGLDRSATIVGVGGGVVGDLAGFAAATYLRGVRLVLVPTTLLAQVDAAIGGKVAVDLENAKNLIGAFHPASAVIIDPEVLRTLPEQGLRDGMAEIVKIALMRSASLVEELGQMKCAAEIVEHVDIVRRAAALKIDVVRQDPYEEGLRMQLNYGHTIGHAVEAASGFHLTHGQCVAIGMAAESWLAEREGWAGPDVLPRLLSLLERFGLPRSTPGLDAGDVFAYAKHDKKRARSALRLAVPSRVGEGAVVTAPDGPVRDAIDRALGVMS